MECETKIMTFKKRRLATIDLGTNSLLMLIAERDEQGNLTILHDELQTPRLGEGLRETGKISDAAMERAASTLKDYAAKANSMNVEKILATTTSAMREASNQKEVLERFQSVSGLDVEVITPNEEARLTYISSTSEQGHEDPSMVVDIGGGSTEITWGLGPRFDGGRSLKFGTVKLLEGPLQRLEMPTQATLEQTRTEINQYLTRVTALGELDHYYGTAGSFTHLSSLELQLSSYSAEAVSGHKITPAMVGTWLDRLCTLSREQKMALPGIDPRRMDLLIPGCLIIECLFKKFGNQDFTVYDRGIRYGKLFDALRGFTGQVLAA